MYKYALPSISTDVCIYAYECRYISAYNCIYVYMNAYMYLKTCIRCIYTCTCIQTHKASKVNMHLRCLKLKIKSFQTNKKDVFHWWNTFIAL